MGRAIPLSRIVPVGICAAIVVAASGAASAAAITQTVSSVFEVPSIGFDQDIGGGFVDRFDPAIGTLDRVTVGLSGHIVHDASFGPECPDCVAPAIVSWSTGLSFNLPGFPFRQPGSITGFVILINQPGNPPNEIFVPQLSNLFFDVPFSYTESTTDSLASYLGVGQMFITANGNADSNLCESEQSPIQPACPSSIFLDLSLTYEYTPIPAPASMALLLGGLVGLAALRRGRRRGKARA